MYGSLLLFLRTVHQARLKMLQNDQWIDSSVFLQMQTERITNILLSCLHYFYYITKIPPSILMKLLC